jgi:hypothetical protein
MVRARQHRVALILAKRTPIPAISLIGDEENAGFFKGA